MMCPLWIHGIARLSTYESACVTWQASRRVSDAESLSKRARSSFNTVNSKEKEAYAVDH